MRKVADRLLALGTVLTLLTAPTLTAGADQVPSRPRVSPLRVAQNQAPLPDPLAGQQSVPTVTDPLAGQTQQPPPQGVAQPGQTTVAQPGPTNMAQPGQMNVAPPLTAEIPRPHHGSMTFEMGAGKILTLTLPAANIYVADPKVAEVRPASATSLFVFGISAGHTNIAAVDGLGRLLADYQITVQPSGYGAREAQAAIGRLVPGSRVQVRAQGRGLMLTGAVANAADAAQAMTIAKGYATGENPAIDNQMTIAAPTQVTLQVRIAEMKRSVVRNLGIDWGAGGVFGKVAPAVGAASGVGLAGAAANLLRGSFNGTSCSVGVFCLDGVLNALAKDGLAHILAEPNLTVMSGQPASFQAGGEFPYQVVSGVGGSATASVAFKPYGVILSFVPTVLNDGRINLHVRPEVSALDTTNQLAGSGSSTISTPALTVRRAETTVELGSGESLAIAGMLQTTTSDNGSGIPGFGDTPILGALFKTNNMSREQVELVIIVTPVLVRPVSSPSQLRLPAEGYKPARDFDRLLLMRQMPNSNGTTQARVPTQAGFIVR